MMVVLEKLHMQAVSEMCLVRVQKRERYLSASPHRQFRRAERAEQRAESRAESSRVEGKSRARDAMMAAKEENKINVENQRR